MKLLEKTRCGYGQVPVPHFGVHLKKDIFNKIKANIEANKISYIDKPYTRFEVQNLSKIHFYRGSNGNVRVKSLTNKLSTRIENKSQLIKYFTDGIKIN